MQDLKAGSIGEDGQPDLTSKLEISNQKDFNLIGEILFDNIPVFQDITQETCLREREANNKLKDTRWCYSLVA